MYPKHSLFFQYLFPQDYHFYPYIHELTYSYYFYKARLSHIDKLNTDTIIRLTNYQFTPSLTNGPLVVVFELIPTSTLNQIKKITYSIDSNHNSITSNEELIPLKKSEIKILLTTFQSCLSEKIEYSTKTNQHNPFLIELKLGNYFVIIERSEDLDSDERNAICMNITQNFNH